MLFIAIVLDPRYKLNFVKYWIKEWYGKNKGDAISSKVWNALNRLYVERVGQNATFSSSGSGASLFRNSRPSVGNASLYNCIKSYNNKFKQHLADENNMEKTSKLDRYLLESSENPDVQDFDIFMWWKMNDSKYQSYSEIAHDVLAIPIATVGSKSVFSTTRHVLDSFHSSLSPKIVETLLYPK